MLEDIRVSLENSSKRILKQKQISLCSAYKTTKLLKTTTLLLTKLRNLIKLSRIIHKLDCATANGLDGSHAPLCMRSRKMHFSDECWFHLSGYVKSQNSCYWSAQNPHPVCRNSLYIVRRLGYGVHFLAIAL